MKRPYPLYQFVVLCIWVCCNPLLVHAQTVPDLNSVYGVRWSPDGTLLAISGRSGLWLYHIATSELESLPADQFAFNSWTQDNRIYTGFAFFNLSTHSLENPIVLQQEPFIFSRVIDLSHDAKTIAFLEGDYLDVIAIYDTETGALIRRIETHNLNAGSQIEWSPDNSRFAMLTPDRPSVLIIPNADNPTITEYSLKESPLYQPDVFPFRVKWSPDGRLLAIGVSSSQTFLLDMQSGTFVGELQGQSPETIAWSPDGKRLAAGSWDGTITVWEVESRQAISKFKTFGYLYNIEFSPYGATLAVGTDVEKAQKEKYLYTPAPQDLSINDKSLYIRTIGGSSAVQLFVPAPSAQQLQSLVNQCGKQISLNQTLSSEIAANQLLPFVNQVSQATSDQIPPGCAADLIAVANALMTVPQ